jgi:hypothetical protein
MVGAFDETKSGANAHPAQFADRYFASGDMNIDTGGENSPTRGRGPAGGAPIGV